MSNLIDNLVSVTISISSGVANEASFNNVLLVDYNAENADYSGVGVFTTSSEVSEAGWATDSDIYAAAVIAFANGASELYITVKGADEEISDALDRAAGTTGWYGLYVVGAEDTEYETIAEWAEANSKLFGYTADCSDEISNPVTGSYNYALGIATKSIEDNEANTYLGLAYMAKVMTYQPGSETWAYKTLSGVTTDDWTNSEITELKAANLNYYVTCASKDITLNGVVLSGEYIDIIRFRDWLINDMQTRVLNLFIKNAKVPYTDAGITLIENAMIASLKEGQNMGGIAETSYDSDGNKTEGYTVSVPDASSVSDSDRAARTLRNCTFTARLTGAIHLVKITGTLSV